MSTILIAAILVTGIAAITITLVAINNKHQKKSRGRLLHRFSEVGSDNNLSFTSQEILNGGIIGLDGLNRKLVILEKNNDEFNWSVINLEDIKSCTVKKIFQATPIGALKRKTIEEHLEKIVLHLEMKNEKASIEIPFFVFSENHIYQLAEMEQKAKHWEAILSKFITGRIKKTA